MAAELVVLLLLMLCNPTVGEELARIVPVSTQPPLGVDYAALMVRDPPLGQDLSSDPQWVSAIRGTHAATRGWVVVWVGSCAGCIKVDVRSWEQSIAKARLQAVLLTSADPTRATEFRRDLHLSSPLVCDPQGKLATKLNTAWLGRSYLIAPNGRLRWLSRIPWYRASPTEDRTLQAALRQLGAAR